MIDKKAVYVLAIFATIACCDFLAAQNDGNESLFETVLRQESSQKLSNEELREIVNVRKRLGGGTGLELDEVLFKNPFTSQANPEKYFKEIDESESFEPVEFAEKLFWQMLDSSKTQKTQPTFAASADSKQDAKPANIDGLRSIARRLEEIAADMENHELFDDADELRSRAANIWRQTHQQIRNARRNSASVR